MNKATFTIALAVALVACMPAGAAMINTYPTTIVTTASSYYTSSGGAPPANLVNGSGLTADSDGDGLDEHNNNYLDMWLTQHGGSVVGDAWVAFDLGQTYSLDFMRVWNYNQEASETDGHDPRSIATAKIWYSTLADPTEAVNPDTSQWTQLVGTGPDGAFEFLNRGTGANGFDDVDDLDLGDTSARHVLIDVETNYGSTTYVGLSEVQFFQVPEPGTLALLGVGGLALALRRRRRA